jgi:hypothetical protein
MSDFAFFFYGVYVQRRLLFTRRFLFIDAMCFDLTGHLQVDTWSTQCNRKLQYNIMNR